MNLPNPLDIPEGIQPKRILSDKGIKQAIDFGLIKTTPAFDYNADTKRIQPATLDVKAREIDEIETIDDENIIWNNNAPKDKIVLKAGSISSVNLTEFVEFNNFYGHPFFISPTTEARSSLRVLGCFIPDHGIYFFSGPKYSQIELGNFSQNDIIIPKEERIAQILFHVNPFADRNFNIPENKNLTELGEKARSLDMGVEVWGEHLKTLEKTGDLKVSPKLSIDDSVFVVHAGNVAYRMKKIEKGIDFSKRNDYTKDMLWEPIDISNGYTIKPFEHVMIETVEKFELSNKVGIRFWDNLSYDEIKKRCNSFSNPKDVDILIKNTKLMWLTDGWVDPGYIGSFSRQPKWMTERKIYPGDIVGYGQVFYFPNGTGKSYGDSSLGSQHQNKEKRF